MKKKHRPQPPPTTDEWQRENQYVRYAVQAMLGQLSSNVRAVALRVLGEDRVRLTCWVRAVDQHWEDTVDAITECLEAVGRLDVEVRVHLAAPEAPAMSREHGVLLYWSVNALDEVPGGE